MTEFAYVPIRHERLDSYYRVPVWVTRNKDGDVFYDVSVGDNARRMFNEQTVPHEIKAVVAMVDAFPRRSLPHVYWSPAGVAAYVCPDPKQMEVGWHVAEDMYMLVLPRKLLDHIYITGAGNG